MSDDEDDGNLDDLGEQNGVVGRMIIQLHLY